MIHVMYKNKSIESKINFNSIKSKILFYNFSKM